MSYILDALKKSEEERRKLEEQQRAPYSSAIGGKIVRRRRKIVPAMILSLSLLFIVLALSAGWWFVNIYPIEKEEISSAPASTTMPAPEKTKKNQIPDQQKSMANQDNLSDLTPPAAAVPPSQVDSGVLKQSLPEKGSEKIPLMADLSFSTRSMLPEMQFRGHVYSPAAEKRMIMINSTVMREGDLVAPELTLKEITDTGLILKYRETVFQVKLF